MLEHRARAAEVDAVAILALHDEVRDRRHVDDRLRAELAEDVLGGALADVDLVHLDAGRRVAERAAVDADDVVTELEEALREHLAETAADAGNEDPHRCLRLVRTARGLAAPTAAAGLDERRDALLHLLDVRVRSPRPPPMPVPSKIIGSE